MTRYRMMQKFNCMVISCFLSDKTDYISVTEITKYYEYIRKAGGIYPLYNSRQCVIGVLKKLNVNGFKKINKHLNFKL